MSAGVCVAAEVVSVRDGKWSEPGTWEGGKVPGDGDWVEVAAATRVEYDVVSEAVLPGAEDPPTFTDVQRIFNRSCIECHGGADGDDFAFFNDGP